LCIKLWLKAKIVIFVSLSIVKSTIRTKSVFKGKEGWMIQVEVEEKKADGYYEKKNIQIKKNVFMLSYIRVFAFVFFDPL